MLLLLCACPRTPVDDYVPKSPAEKEIHAVVSSYLAAKKAMDVHGLLGVLHDEGQYQFAHWRWMSKRSLERRLPVFWRQLSSGDWRAFPMCRENLTGDFFSSGRYFDPDIAVQGDRAKVALLFSVGVWGLGHDLSLRREDGRWWIDGLSWQQN